MEPIVKLENLSVVYEPGKNNETWALKDVTLEIYPEEYIIFFGPSGCGKSTLLYVIAGLEAPTRGKVIVNGKNLKSLSKKEIINFHCSTIGMIFQAYYLLPALSIKNNILLPQIFAEASFYEREKRVKFLMERFEISHLKDRNPSQLSGGQQQRVAIARALINDPLIILADEPTGNLDSKNAEVVLDLLEELNEKDKKTVIHVTHNPQNLYRAHRVFHMRDGEIIRVTRNPKKTSPTGFAQEKISEMEELAQLYPWLPESRLKAKLILNHFLFPYGKDILSKMEMIIDGYLRGELNKEEMFKKFDQPEEKGGLNLYTQKARELTKKITKMIEEIKIVEERKTSILTPIQEKAIKIRKYLLDEYKGQLSLEQIKRLDEFLEKRITGKVNKKTFRELIDKPFKEGGVGLNKRTAKKFADKVEIILMKK